MMTSLLVEAEAGGLEGMLTCKGISEAAVHVASGAVTGLPAVTTRADSDSSLVIAVWLP